jgi:uncharacterized heparinase superfamily protein
VGEPVLKGWTFVTRRRALKVADWIVTSAFVRWTWTGPSSGKPQVLATLSEYRPTDRETVIEMMAGRYLLASRLVDTHGSSPFAVDTDDDEWYADLQGFSWLRHFRDARDEGERSFARTLVLDWIAREGRFDRETWDIAVCAQRVINWLRHYPLIVEGATPEQAASIAKALDAQVQSLNLRAPLCSEPVDALLATAALLGMALSDEARRGELPDRVNALKRMLGRQIDAQGMHRSRNPRAQLQLLGELVSIRTALKRDFPELATDIAEMVENMHRALDAVTLGTGEPAYFNGAGHLPHDLLIAVQAQSTARRRESGVVGGYGRLACGDSVAIADGGQVPPPEFALEAHAGALGFEFTHGTELLVGSCGPSPADMPDSKILFRQGIAHSAPTINAVSAAVIPPAGALAGRLVARGGGRAEIAVDAADDTLLMRTDAYERRFGVTLERRLTLLSAGKSLVGQDRMVGSGGHVSGVCTARFHLASGARLFQGEDEDLLRVHLASGAVWTFLWEGAEMRVEDSVRQSAYFGFHRTRQIVLEAPVEAGHEIAWIFTLVENEQEV